jgi:hypothetical protein
METSSATPAFWSFEGVTSEGALELEQKCGNAFQFGNLPFRYPLEDEPSVASWSAWMRLRGQEPLFEALRRRLVELQFPIRAGISETDEYRAITRRGASRAGRGARRGLELEDPQGLRLWIQQTPAGRLPVLMAARREDFVTLVQALTRRNEPLPVPPATGACIVSGYNDWGRIEELRLEWEGRRGLDGPAADWSAEFKNIARRPELYQSRFILLSSGPYSGVAAGDLGLSPADWEQRSVVIRREHECTHYFTRRVLGSMRNAPGDELIADYMCLVESEGRYRADWFLRFMGLEGFPRYREGGRLESYRGEPPLSDTAFIVLQSLMRRAAENLEVIDQIRLARGGLWTIAEKARLIIALARLGLEGLASPGAGERCARAFGSRSSNDDDQTTPRPGVGEPGWGE